MGKEKGDKGNKLRAGSMPKDIKYKLTLGSETGKKLFPLENCLKHTAENAVHYFNLHH